jgi:hypothetical protein
MGRSQRLRRHRGILETERQGSWLQHWREPYLQALAMSWPVFLALVAFAYGAINALFAVLYRLDPTGIAGVRAAGLSWAEAFFFSVQTLGSIGYGAMHPISLYTNLVVRVSPGARPGSASPSWRWCMPTTACPPWCSGSPMNAAMVCWMPACAPSWPSTK